MNLPLPPGYFWQRVTDRLIPLRDRVVSTVFGDRGGLVVFVATALALALLWRVGIFITDSMAVANAVANVANGQLAVVDAPYSLSPDTQPGLVEIDGQYYARNYGQVYLGVVLTWLLSGVAAVVPVSLLLLASWCLGLVSLSRAGARLLDRPRLEIAGSALAVGVLVASLPATAPVGPDRIPLIALQLSTVLVTAGAATISYRLLAHLHTRRAGVVAGTLVAVATPLGFWSSLPKRHALAAALVLAAVYCFAVSRADARPWTRAAGYGAIGLLSAVHAFEAAFVLLVFAPIDLLTAPGRDRRTLAIVAVVFALSLAPMLATNAAISGDPLAPPRFLSEEGGGFPAGLGNVEAVQPGSGGAKLPASGGTTSAQGELTRPDSAVATSSASVAPLGPPTGPDDRVAEAIPLWLGAVVAVVERAWFVVAFVARAVSAGLAAATEPDRLFHVFVRSGWNPFVRYHLMEFQTVDLAFLEVLPLAGALAYLPVAGVRRLGGDVRDTAASLRAGLAEPVRQTDLLVGSLGVTFVLIYLPRLPLHSQITLRYVVPAMALVAYGVVRLGPVRRAIDGAPRVLGIGYLLSTVAVVVAISVAVATMDLAVGEAMQLQALVGLGAAGLAGLVVGGWPLHRDERAVALGVAVAAGVGTAFLVLSSFVYLEYGRHALALARFVADILPAVA